jgi:GT2 family glycosyltransferase
VQRKHPSSVAIIIVNWKSAEWTMQCVTQLLEQDHPSISIIVVDNGSGPDEVAQLQERLAKNITFIPLESNTGFTGGNNAGLSTEIAQSADYVLLLNNDTHLESNFVRRLLDEAGGQVGIFGPVIYNWKSDTIQSAGGSSINLWTGTVKTRKLYTTDGPSLKSSFVSGCCFLIHNEVLKRIGSLDNDFFLYYEETDYCIRALKEGFPITVLGNVSIQHFDGGSSGGTSTTQERMLARNRLRLIHKHGNIAQWLYGQIFMLCYYGPLRTLLLLAKRSGSQPILAFWKGIMDGLAIPYRTSK